jgi:hypothetical protein
VIEGFRNWLQGKYGSITELSGAWRRPLNSFAEVGDPQAMTADRKEDLLPRLDWVEFEESLAPDSPEWRVSAYLPDTVQIGGDTDERRRYERIRNTYREVPKSEAPSAMPEVCHQAALETRPELAAFFARAALMHDAFGTVSQDITLDESCCRLAGLVNSTAWETDRKIILLYPRIYAQMKRLLVEMAAAKATGAVRDFGLLQPFQTAAPALFKRFIDMAAKAKVSFVITDSRLPLKDLRQYPLVVCPTLEMLAGETMRTFEAYVEGGGFLALGPRIPVHDEYQRRDTTLARHFGGHLTDFALSMRPCGEGCFLTLPHGVSAGTIDFLAFESGIARGLVADSEHLESAIRRHGSRRLLFAANPLNVPVATTFSGEPFARFRDVDTDEELPMTAETSLTVPAFTVCAWEVF